MKNKELFELTNPQKSIWYTEQFYEGTTVNNICVSGTLYGKINEDILKQAINNVVLQNDSFRIHVIIENNIPKQYISDYKKFDIDVEYINSESEIKQIEKNPNVAIASDWFTAHGKGNNLGYFGKEENRIIAEKLKIVFAEWIDNGHNDFDDENTIILCVKLTDGLLLSHGTRYEF